MFKMWHRRLHSQDVVSATLIQQERLRQVHLGYIHLPICIHWFTGVGVDRLTGLASDVALMGN